MISKLDIIKNEMFIGNWSEAKKLFRKINCNASEYSSYLKMLDPDDSYNFCMLGFYTRSFIPTKKQKENDEKI